MKILIFSPYYPPHIGGLESHADEFNKYLSQKGIDITIFTPRLPKNAPEKEIRHDNVKIIRFPAFEIIPSYPLPKFWSAKFWKLFFALFKAKFDIVISRTRFFNTSILALVYAKIEKVKWIHIEHGSDFVKSGGRLSVAVAKAYDYTFGKLVLKLSDKVIANSNASAEFCKKITNRNDCDVIYRGIQTEKILSVPENFEFKKKYAGKIKISFLGRLFDGKGTLNLLEALSMIKRYDFVCFIMGDGPEKKKLVYQAKRFGINDNIIFFGFLDFEKYISILKISDIFVNPSYTEGMPTTVTEAALCKNAIIATNVGGTKEIINEKNGFLIEPKNVQKIKEKLQILMNDGNLRKKMGESAYEEVINKFNWNNSTEKYLKIFTEIIK